MKCILIFSISYFPFIGGAEIAVKEITSRIKDFEFDLITARFDRKLSKYEKIGNVNVYRIGWGLVLDKYFFPLIGFLKALSLEKKRKYSLGHAIMASRAGAAAFLFKLFHPKIPLLLTLQEGDSPEYMKKRIGIFYPFYRLFFKKVDFIQAISQYLADYAKKMGAVCPIKIVPNGVDLKKFKIQDSVEVENLRQSLKIKKGEKVIITTSRLVEKNALNDLIRALKELPITYRSQVKLLILGEGWLKAYLQELVQSLNLQNQVLFLDHINHKDLPFYLNLSDIFIRPSLSEGLGSSFLEAMACGLPIIATPVGGIPDFLKDRETGLFCEVRNPKSIAEKIIELLTNDNLREAIIRKSLNLIRKNYNWEEIAKKMRNLYRHKFTH